MIVHCSKHKSLNTVHYVLYYDKIHKALHSWLKRNINTLLIPTDKMVEVLRSNSKNSLKLLVIAINKVHIFRQLLNSLTVEGMNDLLKDLQ